MVPVITVDGPSGTGKGTLAQRVAMGLAWHLLDSGALYRVLAHAALAGSIRLDDQAGLATLAARIDLRFAPASKIGGEVSVVLDGEDVTDVIRTETCGKAASDVAALTEVRDALLSRQQAFRQVPGLVADGRDMGTVVFPDAQVKVFLTASPKERAQRRYKQLKQKGMDVTLARLLDQIVERDKKDTRRAVSPLRPAADASVIDTTGIGIQEVERRIMDLVNRAGIGT